MKILANICLVLLSVTAFAIAGETAVRNCPFSSVTRNGKDIVGTLSKEGGDYKVKGIPNLNRVGPGEIIPVKSNSQISLSTHLGIFEVSNCTLRGALGLLIVNTYRLGSASEQAVTTTRFIKTR